MNARNEKPSETESSTDTLIGALEIIGNLLESTDDENAILYAQTVREAAQRLDKLEKDLGYSEMAANAEAQFVNELSEKLKSKQANTPRDYRKELWIQVAVAYASTPNSQYPSNIAKLADAALDAYDKRFGNNSEITK